MADGERAAEAMERSDLVGARRYANRALEVDPRNASARRVRSFLNAPVDVARAPSQSATPGPTPSPIPHPESDPKVDPEPRTLTGAGVGRSQPGITCRSEELTPPKHSAP